MVVICKLLELLKVTAQPQKHTQTNQSSSQNGDQLVIDLSCVYWPPDKSLELLQISLEIKSDIIIFSLIILSILLYQYL